MRFVIPKAFLPSTKLLAVVASLAIVATAAAPAAAQTPGWQPGPGASGDNTYTGFIDTPSGGATVPGSGAFTLAGWFVDQSAEGWAGADQGQVWLGTMEGGGKMLATAQIAQSRPDVGTALGNPYYASSGFSAVVQGSSVPSGNQTLYMYMHTPGKGWWYRTINVTGGGAGTAAAPAAAGAPAAAPTTGGTAPTLVVNSPTEGQNVTAKGSATYTITGVANDPVNGPSAIDSVDVWINGERDSQGGQDLGQAQYNTGDGTWSLAFSPTKFPSTHTNIYVYAHSKVTGQTTEVVRGFNIVG